MNITEQVLNRIKRLRRGVPFSINKLYELGSQAAVQKAMSRLVERGEIKRLDRGFYARPKELRLSKKPYFGSAEELAMMWAKEHGHKLVNQGMEEAYRLGMQTQAPMKKVFWTDGSPRTFAIGNEVVHVVKKTNLELLKNTNEGALLRGLSVIDTAHFSESNLKVSFKRLSLSENQAIHVIDNLTERKFVPGEIKRVLENTKRELESDGYI